MARSAKQEKANQRDRQEAKDEDVRVKQHAGNPVWLKQIPKA
jgi:hypothetical protein